MWRELVPSWRLVCRCHGVFLWCYVCFVLLRFRLHAFAEAAALRSIVLRYAGAPIATRFFFFFGDVAFSDYYFLYQFRFLFVWRVRRTFFPSELCFLFFCLVTMGWIFDISSCENSINQSFIPSDTTGAGKISRCATKKQPITRTEDCGPSSIK